MEKIIDSNQKSNSVQETKSHVAELDSERANEMKESTMQNLQKMYFIDGCFDGYHYGHVNALFQAKQLCYISV